MEKEKIIIAHLSDLHLTESNRQKRRNPRISGRVKGMNDAFKNIITSKPIKEADLIIITGDVTDRGDIESWRFFWKEIKAAGLNSKVFIVPGNHDTCCLGARFPIGKKMYRLYDLEKVNNGLKIGNHSAQFPWVRQYDKRVVIFGLNSTNLGNFTFLSNAMGRISQNQLLNFAQQLYTYRNVPVKIVLLHHSPNITGIASSEKAGRKLIHKMELTGRKIRVSHERVLLLLCIAHGVQLIAHGHAHNIHERIVNGIHIVGASSTTQRISTSSGRNIFQFYTYTIHDHNARVIIKLEKIQI